MPITSGEDKVRKIVFKGGNAFDFEHSLTLGEEEVYASRFDSRDATMVRGGRSRSSVEEVDAISVIC